MDVDPVEVVTKTEYDYIIIAKVDKGVTEKIIMELMNYGVSRKKILAVSVPDGKAARESLLEKFLNLKAIG